MSRRHRQGEAPVPRPPAWIPVLLLVPLAVFAAPPGPGEAGEPATPDPPTKETGIPFDAQDYYPLALGNTWIWSGRGPADIRVRTVVGRVETPTGVRWELETRSRDGSLRSRDILLHRDGLIYRQATLLPDGDRIDYQPPILYAPFSATVGEERETDMLQLSAGDQPRSYWRKSIIEDVGATESSVAGFPDAIAVSFASYPDRDFPMAETLLVVWFARNFGPLRLQVKNLAGEASEEVVYARIGAVEVGVDPRTGTATP